MSAFRWAAWAVALACLACEPGPEPGPAAPAGEGDAQADAAPADPADAGSSDAAIGRADAASDPPAADATLPDSDPWPAPTQVPPSAVTVVHEGALLLPGEALWLQTPPAGLSAAIAVPLTVTNHADAPLTLGPDALTGAGFAFAGDPPAAIEPGGSARVALRLSAADVSGAGEVEARLALGPDGALALRATVPPPLRLVAVGDGGLTLVSDDYGASFQVAADPGPDDTRRHTIAWGPGGFLRTWAIGPAWQDPGRYALSSDGHAWQPVEAADEFWPSGCAALVEGFTCAISDRLALASAAGVVPEATRWGPMLHGIASADGRVVGVGRSARLAVSLDGQTWLHEQQREGGDRYHAVAWQPGGAHGRWFAVGGERRFRVAQSTDGGLTWSEGEPLEALPDAWGTSIACTAERCLVGLTGGAPLAALTGEADWRAVQPDLPGAYQVLGQSNGWFIASLRHHADGHRLVRSRDGGAWTPVYDLPEGWTVQALATQTWSAP